MKLRLWKLRRKTTALSGFIGPYRAYMEPSSNGYASVIDSEGRDICTAYVNGMERAIFIAAALNAYEACHDAQ